MVLRGVGPERVFQLGRLGIHTVGDLLLHAPRRYEDRRKFITIRELELGKSATVFGKIIAAGVKRYRGGARSVYEFVIEDGSARLHCRWWNLPFLERIFAVGDEVMVFGKPNLLKPRTMDHPETEKVEGGDDVTVHINRVVPVYPLTEGLPQRSVRSFLWRAVEEFAGQVGEPEPRLVPVGAGGQGSRGAGESVPVSPLPPFSPAFFPTRADAVRVLHFPAEIADAERARRRLALDEFVALQLEIQRRRQNLERNARAFPCGGDNRLMKPFLAALGFKLTGAQVRVLRELRADLAGPVPMRRLLQGDVGSGKTVVAAGAALMALESGCDVALMAPTEILAAQLHRNLAGWLGPLGIAVDLRTGSHRQRAASVPLAATKPGPSRMSTTEFASTMAGEPCRQDAGSTLCDPFFDRGSDIERYLGWLPHWRQAEKLYFVTFRLEDSVDQQTLKLWQQEREVWERHHPKPWDDAVWRERQERFTRRSEEQLDAGHGSCALRRPDVGEIVVSALRQFDGDRYQLGDFVVMPNHVHVLVRPAPGHGLDQILHSWKSFTSKAANRSLGRTGAFWREESFDYLVRSEAQYQRFRDYISENPRKACLPGDAYRLGAGSFTLPWPEQRAASVPLAATKQGTSRMSMTDLALMVPGEPCRQDAGSTLVVGTHALLEDSVGLGKLGLVIIDEQHKFGVAQRETLLRKGRDGGRFPHLLVMTATPIPRTLGLTLYGDLDVTLLDEVPAGRGRIRTHVRDAAALPKVWQFVRAELEKGRQAYVVYPRVSESDRDEVKAVTKEFARVQQELAPHGVGLLHGQLRAEEKDRVMAAFRAGTTKVLVATSVIEVGVDVPNATVMLIEDAEQFGLAQLHQLRGRIGRGAHESHCILVAEQKTDAAKARLKVLAETTDGFALAEADLRLRGPGELIGRQQSGVPEFRFGDLRGDRDLVELARSLVRTHLRGK